MPNGTNSNERRSSDGRIGYVLSSSTTSIRVAIDDQIAKGDAETFTEQQVYERMSSKGQLQVGNYLKISSGNFDSVIAIIVGIDSTLRESEGDERWQFIFETQPIGTLNDQDEFSRGSAVLPIPLEPVWPVSNDMLLKIYASGEQYNFRLGRLSMNQNIPVYLDGDRFFSKHIAVVGSTGSGKSCTVTRILHEAVGISLNAKNRHSERQKNSHIVVFDLHAEYENAFRLDTDQEFTLNTLAVDSLILPYWLMNSEELESMFIESNEQTSYNQVSAFKKAVIENKRQHNQDIEDRVTYDSPVYFSLTQVLDYIKNLNIEVISGLDGESNAPKLTNGDLLDGRDGFSREDYYFDGIQEFVPLSTKSAIKATKGQYNGKFSRFISRLENIILDKRLSFLMSPYVQDRVEYTTGDYGDIVRQYIGYVNKSNVTIVDLSGIPFEVLSICISLISRVIFDFCFYYTKFRHDEDATSDVPVLIVCEEAHTYVPKSESVQYRASRSSIERIAKEGRKYGLSLMMVSQRPSEVSETIFAQCNNFVALRLTNTNDQGYVKKLLPDNLNSVTDMLPNLGDGECIAIGDAIPLPSVVQMDMPNPQPKSQSVRFHKEWQKDWVEDKFDAVIERLKER